MKILSKSDFIKQMSTVKKEEKQIKNKWGNKAKSKALRW